MDLWILHDVGENPVRRIRDSVRIFVGFGSCPLFGCWENKGRGKKILNLLFSVVWSKGNGKWTQVCWTACVWVAVGPGICLFRGSKWRGNLRFRILIAINFLFFHGGQTGYTDSKSRILVILVWLEKFFLTKPSWKNAYYFDCLESLKIPFTVVFLRIFFSFSGNNFAFGSSHDQLSWI